MPELSFGQYSLVYNVLSFVIAAMLGSFIFFVLARDLVARKYRLAVYVSAIVVLIAGYHYFRIFNSWVDAFALQGNNYIPTGLPFNDAYRYVDWSLTVPLLMVELIAVLALPWEKAKGLLISLVFAAFLMIALGYPGEIAKDSTTRLTFFCLSMIPFLYIMYVLFFRLQDAVQHESDKVKSYLHALKILTLVAWSFYPIAFLFNEYKDAASGIVAVQVGYSIADVVAKCGYGLLIFWIARAKSETEPAEKFAKEF